MIKLLGTLKGVTLKSKVGDDDRTYHSATISLELLEGADRVQDVVESLKQIVYLSIENRQPTLEGIKPTQYKEDDEDEK